MLVVKARDFVFFAPQPLSVTVEVKKMREGEYAVMLSVLLAETNDYDDVRTFQVAECTTEQEARQIMTVTAAKIAKGLVVDVQ